jgi:hypothetical protein
MVVELKVFFVDELLFNLTLYLMTIFVGRTFIPRAPWVLRLLLRAQGCLTMRSRRELWSTTRGQHLLHLLLTFGRMVLLATLGRRPPPPRLSTWTPTMRFPARLIRTWSGPNSNRAAAKESRNIQVPGLSLTGPTLRRWEIDWNGTPWQEDIFDDNEDMRVV